MPDGTVKEAAKKQWTKAKSHIEAEVAHAEEGKAIESMPDGTVKEAAKKQWTKAKSHIEELAEKQACATQQPSTEMELITPQDALSDAREKARAARNEATEAEMAHADAREAVVAMPDGSKKKAAKQQLASTKAHVVAKIAVAAQHEATMAAWAHVEALHEKQTPQEGKAIEAMPDGAEKAAARKEWGRAKAKLNKSHQHNDSFGSYCFACGTECNTKSHCECCRMADAKQPADAVVSPHVRKVAATKDVREARTHLDSKRSDPSHTDEDHDVEMDGLLDAAHDALNINRPAAKRPPKGAAAASGRSTVPNDSDTVGPGSEHSLVVDISVEHTAPFSDTDVTSKQEKLKTAKNDAADALKILQKETSASMKVTAPKKVATENLQKLTELADAHADLVLRHELVLSATLEGNDEAAALYEMQVMIMVMPSGDAKEKAAKILQKRAAEKEEKLALEQTYTSDLMKEEQALGKKKAEQRAKDAGRQVAGGTTTRTKQAQYCESGVCLSCNVDCDSDNRCECCRATVKRSLNLRRIQKEADDAKRIAVAMAVATAGSCDAITKMPEGAEKEAAKANLVKQDATTKEKMKAASRLNAGLTASVRAAEAREAIQSQEKAIAAMPAGDQKEDAKAKLIQQKDATMFTSSHRIQAAVRGWGARVSKHERIRGGSIPGKVDRTGGGHDWVDHETHHYCDGGLCLTCHTECVTRDRCACCRIAEKQAARHEATMAVQPLTEEILQEQMTTDRALSAPSLPVETANPISPRKRRLAATKDVREARTHLDSKRSDPSHTDEDHHVEMDGLLDAAHDALELHQEEEGDAVAVEKARRLELARTTFEALDKDGSGALSKDEFKTILSKANPNIDQEGVEKEFKKAKASEEMDMAAFHRWVNKRFAKADSASFEGLMRLLVGDEVS